MPKEVRTRVVRLDTPWEVAAARERASTSLMAGEPGAVDTAHECGACGAVLLLECVVEDRTFSFPDGLACRVCGVLNRRTPPLAAS